MINANVAGVDPVLPIKTILGELKIKSKDIRCFEHTK